jgi:hypothetical protein
MSDESVLAIVQAVAMGGAQAADEQADSAQSTGKSESTISGVDLLPSRRRSLSVG